MAREKKHRVPVEAAAELCTNPFASLAIDGRESAPGGTGIPPVTTQSKPSPKERLLLRRETAHRGGKTVIVLEGFSPVRGEARLAELLHELKAALGCGGKVNGRRLELQGELADRLQPLLEAREFAVKRGW